MVLAILKVYGYSPFSDFFSDNFTKGGSFLLLPVYFPGQCSSFKTGPTIKTKNDYLPEKYIISFGLTPVEKGDKINW